MPTILVIGANGNIGKAVVDTLIQNSIKVRATSSHSVTNTAETELFTPVYFDFLNPKSYRFALGEATKVFFIRPPQLAKPKKEIFPFLHFLKSREIEHIVFVSLLGVEKNPITPHHKIEKEIIRLNLPYTFLRPSFFMQNLNTTHQADIKVQQDLFIPAGNSKTSFIDTRDIGEVAAKCLCDSAKYTGKSYPLTGREALTYQEVADIMTEVLNKPITYSKPSLLRFRSALLRRQVAKDYVNVMVMLYLITQLGNAKRVTNDVEQILGRKPTSLKEYIQDYQSYFI